jgi:hypothetical protein
MEILSYSNCIPKIITSTYSNDINQIITSYIGRCPLINIIGCIEYTQYTELMNSIFKILQEINIYVDVLRVMESIDDYYVLKMQIRNKV